MQELKKYSFPGVDKISVEEQFLLLETASLLDCEASASAAQALQITELLVTREGSSAKVKVAHLKALVSTGQLDQAKEVRIVQPRERRGVKIMEFTRQLYSNHISYHYTKGIVTWNLMFVFLNYNQYPMPWMLFFLLN